jgi:hypothetical protein
MPRQKSLVTVIRDLVRKEVSQAMSSLLSGLGVTGAKAPARKRGPGRPPGKKRGPGRPPGKKRGPGRPKGSKNKPKTTQV